jgi:hypothetical protein
MKASRRLPVDEAKFDRNLADDERDYVRGGTQDMQRQRGIDHLVLAVHDLDQAARRYEAWGFTLTPRAQHPWGTANRLAQFEGCFLELLEIDRPELIGMSNGPGFDFGGHVRRFLAAREGFAMLVFESRDARADAAAFLAAGLEPHPVLDFSRVARQPDGSDATVGFSLAFVTHRDLPFAPSFVCQQHAPQHFWKPQFQRHALGVQGIASVTIQAEAPAAAREVLAALQGADAVRQVDKGFDVHTARGVVRVRQAAEVQAYFGGDVAPGPLGSACYAGFTLAVADLDAVAGRLEMSGTSFRRRGPTIAIAPAQAFGVGIAFTSAIEAAAAS